MLEMISPSCAGQGFLFEKKDLQKNKSALRLPWDRVVRPGPDCCILCLLLRTRVKHKVFCEGRCSKEEVGILASLLKVELE